MVEREKKHREIERERETRGLTYSFLYFLWKKIYVHVQLVLKWRYFYVWNQLINIIKITIPVDKISAYRLVALLFSNLSYSFLQQRKKTVKLFNIVATGPELEYSILQGLLFSRRVVNLTFKKLIFLTPKIQTFWSFSSRTYVENAHFKVI